MGLHQVLKHNTQRSQGTSRKTTWTILHHDTALYSIASSKVQESLHLQFTQERYAVVAQKGKFNGFQVTKNVSNFQNRNMFKILIYQKVFMCINCSLRTTEDGHLSLMIIHNIEGKGYQRSWTAATEGKGYQRSRTAATEGKGYQRSRTAAMEGKGYQRSRTAATEGLQMLRRLWLGGNHLKVTDCCYWRTSDVTEIVIGWKSFEGHRLLLPKDLRWYGDCNWMEIIWRSQTVATEGPQMVRRL